MKITVACLSLLLSAATASADATHPVIKAPDALKCFHPTAHFIRHVRLADHWEGAAGYGADRSEIDRIFYSGDVTAHPYRLDAAVLWRKGMVRLVLLSDTAVVPPDNTCPLLNWNG